MKNIKKKKVHKNIGGVLFFLSALSVFSVGFSSWTINKNNTAEATLAIEVDDVISDVIEINNKFPHFGVTSFELGEEGFIYEGQFTNTAYLTYYLKVNSKNYIATGMVGTDLSLNVTLNQSESGFQLLNSTYMQNLISFDLDEKNTFDNTASFIIDEATNSGYSNFIISHENFGKEDIFFSLRFTFVISNLETYKAELALFEDESISSFQLGIKVGI